MNRPLSLGCRDKSRPVSRKEPCLARLSEPRPLCCAPYDGWMLQIFDLLTVNETAYEPPEDDRDSINSVFSLSREASMINQNFTQQAQRSAAVEYRDCCSARAHRAVGRWGASLTARAQALIQVCVYGHMLQVMLRDKEQQYAFQHAHPFSSTMEELASTAYKYRKWQLTPDMALIARCEVDGTTALWAQHYHACRPIDSTGKSVALFYRSPRPSAALVPVQAQPRARTTRSNC